MADPLAAKAPPGSALDPAGLATLYRSPFFLGLTPAQTRAKEQALDSLAAFSASAQAARAFIF